jgi:hypothetical protein
MLTGMNAANNNPAPKTHSHGLYYKTTHEVRAAQRAAQVAAGTYVDPFAELLAEAARLQAEADGS